MHVNVVVLGVRDHHVVTFHGYLGQSRVLQSKHSAQEKCINQVAIIIQERQFNCKVPRKLTLNDTQAFSIGRSGLLEHFVDEARDFYSHFRKRVGLLCVLSRVHQRSKVQRDLHITLIRLARPRTDHFERALRHNLCLADAQHDLAILFAKLDLIDLPGCIAPLVIELGLPDQTSLLRGPGIRTAVQIDRLDQKLALVLR